MMREKPCVLLISPGIVKHTDRDFGLPHLVSLGGYLQHPSLPRLDIRVELLDLDYEGADQRQLQWLLDRFAPHLLIGICCYSSFDHLRVMSLARFIKRLYPDVPLVCGGYHPSAVPDAMLVAGSAFDAVIPGEGELPLRRAVETLLGGGRLERGVCERELVQDLDSLPPYRWELLDRYWKRARDTGSKLQIYLSRGCPHRCTFCMERAKGDHRWRAFSVRRALEELDRLRGFTELQHWVVNVADPLFGFKRSWRRQLLEGLIRQNIQPRQFWTLTRPDDLDQQDVELLARARFSIGIGIESASPRMLQLMNKARKPGLYLEAVSRLARLSRESGLNWAANIIVGHPGETPDSLRESHRFVEQLFTSGPDTRGWLSVDPFRLYPGSFVHQHTEHYEQRFGTWFHRPDWWRSWYDTGFFAEHLDPSEELGYAERVRLSYELFGPLVQQIGRRFRGQGRDIDQVFRHSLREQARMMSDEVRDRLLQQDRWQRNAPRPERPEVLAFPIGLQVRDPRIRLRESAVRRLLELGVLRSEALIEALLVVSPEAFLGEEEARTLLQDRAHEVREGEPPAWLGFRTYVLALESLRPEAGGRVADLLAVSGYLPALLARLVGREGQVVAVHPGSRRTVGPLRARLDGLQQVQVVRGMPTTVQGLTGTFQCLWLGAALPRLPAKVSTFLDPAGGRLATLLGPRFSSQDLVCVSRRDNELSEQIIGRIRAPVVAGPNGWLRSLSS